MGFYDNYNFEGLKFLSQIKTHQDPLISVPCFEFLNIVHNLKTNSETGNIVVAEIGICFGATALQILSLLDENDSYCCLDFEDTLQAFIEDLQTERFEVKCPITAIGNSRDSLDSYTFGLSDATFQMREKNLNGLFDAVYLNGNHSFLHDGLAVCLLKDLIKSGGFLVMEDIFRNYSNVEEAEGKVPEKYRNDAQLVMVQELLLNSDERFEKLSYPQSPRTIFKKK